ncbi:hypothetical protein [Halorarum halophilum]|nr:hypothetical protein [Halobaculum halophilum]
MKVPLGDRIDRIRDRAGGGAGGDEGDDGTGGGTGEDGTPTPSTD